MEVGDGWAPFGLTPEQIGAEQLAAFRELFPEAEWSGVDRDGKGPHERSA
ncbi:hypothetical protein ONA70_26140 [Micromonospora yasonensis]|nr:hypothetical protein [Micromonospora yasonensis]MCW3843589.1 hypothetical protein [Micromonospora yasonensis]